MRHSVHHCRAVPQLDRGGGHNISRYVKIEGISNLLRMSSDATTTESGRRDQQSTSRLFTTAITSITAPSDLLGSETTKFSLEKNK